MRAPANANARPDHRALADAIAVYQMTCKEGGMKEDAALVKKMTANRDARLKEVDEAIAEAKEMEGDTEVNYPLPCVPGRWKERKRDFAFQS